MNILEMTREELLIDISELDFMLTDLNLYLDTHPDDCTALMYFNNIMQQYQVLKQSFTEKYGPLTPHSTSEFKWNWIDNPWPWDKGGIN